MCIYIHIYIVNNVAVAAQLARTEWGCERVLVFDWCLPIRPPSLSLKG